MQNIYQYLSDHNISYQRFDHPAVFTCEEAEQFCPDMPGASIKNLLLRDKDKTHYFLVVAGHDKRVDIKGLQTILGTSKLSFASPEDLNKYLGVEPGSVTLLGLINDAENKVEVIIDKDLEGKSLQCHPLVNTATLVIPSADIITFLNVAKHQSKYLTIPVRA